MDSTLGVQGVQPYDRSSSPRDARVFEWFNATTAYNHIICLGLHNDAALAIQHDVSLHWPAAD